MNGTAIVWIKELRESLRDRRVLINAFLLGPLLGPLIFLLLMRVVVDRELQRAQQPLPVVVIGAEYAPNLLQALRQSGLQVLPPVGNPEQAVRSQRVDLVLRIAPSFAGSWREGELAQVELIYDASRREVGVRAQRLRGMLDSYSRQVAAMRMVSRGLSPTLQTPLLVSERDQATAQSRGAVLFGVLPYMLVLTAFLGGIFLAIDATAGERERQSLEPLLVNPVPRWQVLAGKLLASATFSFASVCLSLAAFALAGALLPTERMDVAIDLGPRFVFIVLPVMVPLVLLIAILQTLVAAFARSYREAQTHLGLLQLIPMIPSALLAFLPFKQQLWMYAVPLLSQQLAIMRLLRGEPVTLSAALLSIVSTLLAALLAFQLARRLYDSEQLAVSA